MRFKIRYLAGLLILLLALSLAGCGKEEEEIKKVKDLDYTVVEEADLPDQLLELVNKKKNSPFCFT